MSSSELAQWLPSVCQIARAAGSEILKIYKSDDINIAYKKDRSPVTNADLKSDQLITEQLQQLTPHMPILSEETAYKHPYSARAQWHTYWLVDPLDGTKGFISKNGFFTVNIALIKNQQAVLGVVYAPASDQLFFAAQHSGAFRQIQRAPSEKISVRTRPRAQPVIAVSRAHINQPTRRLLTQIGRHRLLRADSAIKCCLVADGSADLYLRAGPTCEWDTAAGQCIVEEAGGSLCDRHGQPLRYNAKESLINPPFAVYSAASPQWQAFNSNESRRGI